MDRNKEIEMWPIVKLGEYCHKPEYGLTTSATTISSAPKFLRITDIQDGGVNWDAVPYCESTEDLRESHKLFPGDVVIARIGATTGKAYVIKECPDAVFASYLIRVRTKSDLLPEFLGFYFQTEDYWKQIDQNKGGRLKGGVNIPILQNLSLPLPTLSEQRAIACALRAMQEAREARRKELQLERERKAAIMQYLFTHGTRGESRKQTEIGEMPESWQVMRLREVVTVKGGKRLPKGSDFAQGRTPYPYIRIVDFKEGSVKTADLKYLTADVQKQISRYTISARDVYISIAGTIGLVGVVPEMLEGANLTENAAKLVIQKYDLLDKGFLARYLSGEAGQAQIESLTAKTTQPKLALTRIEQIVIPIPSITEQVEIADIVQACEIKINALQQESLLLDELFRALLEELMTGRLSTLPLIED